MLLLLGLFALTARAQDRIITGYTATSGTAGVKTEENYDKLVDGNRNTKCGKYIHNGRMVIIK